MEKIEIIITLEDFIEIPETERGKHDLFADRKICPLAQSIIRMGIDPTPRVGFEDIRNDKFEVIGAIYPHFIESDFNKLLSGKIKEFKTIYTPRT